MLFRIRDEINQKFKIIDTYKKLMFIKRFNQTSLFICAISCHIQNQTNIDETMPKYLH